MGARRFVIALTVGVLTGACRGADAPAAGEDAAAVPDTTAMEAMPGMPDMAAGADLTGRMTSHMTVMRGMSADSTHANLAAHRQMVGNMIAQMNREMREMGMAGDAAWDATVDSLRTDLTRMPDMTAAEVHALMPAHDRRVMRLMEMHGRMMQPHR